MVLLTLGIAGTATLTGCSGQGATATCDGTTSCTITFERKPEPTKIDILGVSISLERATDTSVTLKVGDQEVTLDKGASKTVGGLTVAVQEVTDSQVIVKVSRN